jgi:hypothetical protein
MVELPDGGASNIDEATQAQAASARSTESIGPYRLLQRSGEGGMGELRRLAPK